MFRRSLRLLPAGRALLAQPQPFQAAAALGRNLPTGERREALQPAAFRGALPPLENPSAPLRLPPRSAHASSPPGLAAGVRAWPLLRGDRATAPARSPR